MQIESDVMKTDLYQDEERLFERLCKPFWLEIGFYRVKRNRGAPGIDGVTCADYESNLKQELSQLAEELANWTYQPQPVRRIEIDKPEGGVRLLGIPCIRDRVVQATLKLLLEPILRPKFSEHSYGFIPNRNQKQAVEAAQRIIKTGKEWVVDIDLEKFFDRIHHDRLISRLGQFIDDKRILRIVGLTLRSGIMKDGLVSPTLEGSVQGSPLSPLLSNVVLDELDKELESRGLEFCRFADDCNLFVKTPKAAHRVMKSIGQFIESKLKLTVNREKSQVARSDQVKFLGMTIIDGCIAISRKSMKRAMSTVRELTPRGTHLTLGDTMEKINRWYRGWSNYYSMTQYPIQLAQIEARIRRRLRSRLIDQQKSKRNLLNKLVKRAVPRAMAVKAVFSNHKRWALSHTRAVERAYPVAWFIKDVGQYVRSTEQREGWFDLRTWVRLR